MIGATGLLGRHVVRASAGRFSVISGGRRSPTGPGSAAVDIADRTSVDRAFLEARPDLVMLLSTIADIDYCESHPEQAFSVNVLGVENVANACSRTNSHLLFTSTAAVFDGRKHGYHEQDEVSPLSNYGRTKVQAERVLRSLTPSAIILRIALVLGRAENAESNGFFDRTMAKWNAGMPVSFPTYESRNPIDTSSLAEIMLQLIEGDAPGGIYHIGSTESVSRYELGKLLAARAGVSADLVRPRSESIPGRAPRGDDHFLLTEKIHQVCRIGIPTISEVIERCFA